MAAADRFVLKVNGKQSHGSKPWTGVDPILTSSLIIQGFQSIISRQTDLTKEAAVISVGLMRSGIRNNIIPEQAELIGTIRTLDTEMQRIIHEKMRLTAEKIAESQGATADLEIIKGYPVTYNDPELTIQAVEWLKNAAGKENVKTRTASTGAEDFSYFAMEVPGFYFFLGGCPEEWDPETSPPHHTPDFFVTDEALLLGMKALINCTLGYMYN
jgi:Metal-dependent amidase/aminoacylase/carboxypeptidase